MTVDLEAVRKLEEQLRADDAVMGDAPWAAVGLIVTCDCCPSGVVATCHQEDESIGIARTRNALPAIADTLRDLREEVERIDTECDEIEAKWAGEVNRLREVAIERDRALVRVKELESDRDRMLRQRAETRDTIHGLPSLVVAAVAERCRNSWLPCFCGCHVSHADGGTEP